jgi:hypothetical protein
MTRSRKTRSELRTRPCLTTLEDRTVPALDFGWAFGIGSTSGDIGRGITTDDAGDFYLTGSFDGTVDFDPGPGTFNLVGPIIDDSAMPPGLPGDPAFVAKYSAAGNFVWAVALDNTTSGNGIAVDGAGYVYATGQGVAQREGFGDGAFVTKLDASTGAIVWTREVGNTHGSGVAADGGGNVYVVGDFLDSSSFGPFTLTFSGYQGFVTKLDAAGNFIWAKATEGSTRVTPTNVAVDSSGNAFVTGEFGAFNVNPGPVDFNPGPGTYNLTTMGGGDVFVWKLDTSGNFVWARNMGSNENDGRGSDIALDSSGNVIVAGPWSGSSRNDFDPGPGTLKLPKGSGYVVKLSSSGNLVWGRSLAAAAAAVEVDGSGNVYTTGRFSGTADFDPGKGNFSLTSAGNEDIFVSKLTSTGNFAGAVRMGGADFDFGQDIAVDGSNNVLTTGRFNTPADFDPGPGTYNLSTEGGTGGLFVSKLTQGSPLLAAGPAIGQSAATINLQKVKPLLREALARWQAAGVDTSGLGRINVRIADLGGTTLGLASGNTIWLDDNAAGWGWFVDRTPRSDSEFILPGNQGEQNRMDLLTVLVHEVGHLLGHDHDEGGAMAETLAAGTRSLIDGSSLYSLVALDNGRERRN